MAIKEENTTAARGDQEEHMDVDSASEVEEMEEEASEEEVEEEPDVAAAADKLEIVGAHGDPTALTFCFKEEDHTLGNSLRHIVNKNPNVDFCGYSLPHPSEAKMHFRIQTTDKTTAIDALKAGLQNLYDVVAHVRSAYAEDLAKKEYVEFEETA